MPRPGHHVHAGRAGLPRRFGKRLDEPCASAPTAERLRQIDVQVRREAAGQLGEVRAEIADVGKALLLGRVLERAHEIAGDRVLARERQQDARPFRRAGSGRASARETPPARVQEAAAARWSRGKWRRSGRAGGAGSLGPASRTILICSTGMDRASAAGGPDRPGRPPPLPSYAIPTYVAFGADLLHCNVVCHIPYCNAQAWTQHSTHQETIMSTITSYDDALDFLPTAEQGPQAPRACWPRSASLPRPCTRAMSPRGAIRS